MVWPDVAPIVTVRCHLRPLAPSHAEEMVPVLADPELYEFIGGHPPTVDELRRRYQAQSVSHSPDGQQWWCNWIVTALDDGHTLGYVQATVERSSDRLQADVAWVIRSGDQGRGLATDAARGMINWLDQHGVDRYTAYIHPRHTASARVASKLGMHRTSSTRDGEIRWESND